jgi:ubiquinone/menaquinone biosynthesis C-methylase UbiE
MQCRLPLWEDHTKVFFNRQTLRNCWEHFDDTEREPAQEILKNLHIKKGNIILEPGCGAGRFTPFLSQLTGPEGQVISFDISGEMIKLAKSREDCPHADFNNFSVHNLPLPDNCIDLIICFNCFHNFNCLHRAVNEMARVLKPGGKLSIAFTQSIEKNNSRYYLPRDKLYKRSIPFIHLDKMLLSSGFNSEKLIMTEAVFMINARLLKEY